MRCISKPQWRGGEPRQKQVVSLHWGERARRLGGQGGWNSQRRMLESKELHIDQTPETSRIFPLISEVHIHVRNLPEPGKGPPERIRHNHSSGSSSVNYTFQAAAVGNTETASGSETSYSTLQYFSSREKRNP